MNSHWTDEQWRSIYLRDKNILISAGAGSGKTAVLTERVFQRIKEGVDVNQLLIVTFTKAAALEMKERIRHRIIKAIEVGEEYLFPQLNLLETAQISTFDSFSMNIVKKYGYLIGIDSDIQIGDDIAHQKLKGDLLDAFLNEKHQLAEAPFVDFVKRYSIKDGTKIRNIFMELTEDLLRRSDYMKIIKHDLEAYHTDEFYQSLIRKVVRWVIDKVWDLRQYLEIMQDAFDSMAIQSHIADIKNSFGTLLETSDYTSMRAIILSHKFPRQPNKLFDEDEEDIKNKLDKYKKKIKAIVDNIKELVKYEEKKILSIMHENYPFEKTLLSLTGEYIEHYFEPQIRTKYFDYATIAHLSIQLVENFPAVRESLQSQYVEILVDEYQDTSPLQDSLIENISSNNLYLVGDIKQSIYRFRGAEPRIFQDKYRKYAYGENSEVIHLNANFRSRKEVIDDINRIFEIVFDVEFGGVNYKDNHQMNFGLKIYDDEEVFNQNYGITFLRYPKDLNEFDMESWDYTKENQEIASFEAQLFIKDIIEKIKDYRVYDKDTKSLRPARYDDFMILIDRKTYFEQFKDAFQAYGIPLHIHKSDAFLSNIDVLVTINLIKLLLSLSSKKMCEEHFKHAFLSLSYSYLFDFTTDQIIDFYTQIEVYEPEHIMKLSKDTVFEPFFNVYQYLIKHQETMTLHDVLMHLHQAFNLIENALKLDRVSAIEERLIFIFEQLKSFDKKMFNLSDLVDYFNYAIDNHKPATWFFSIDIDYVRGTAVVKDKVNLMTIHKSKGLEFPIVYYPNTTMAWASKKEGYRFDDDYGLIIPSVSEGLINTFACFVSDQANLKEALSERLRVLYVALTRAREAMVITYPEDSKALSEELQYDESTEKVYDVLRSMYRSYHDVIHSMVHLFKNQVKNINLNDLNFQARTERMRKEDFISKEYHGDYINYQIIPEPSSTTLEKIEDETIQFVHPNDVEKMQMGTDVHEILKYLDFKKDITSQLMKMDIKLSYQNLIQAFFDQPIMQKALKGKIFKELPFVNPQEEGLIRGIIDLVIEFDDEVYIIDYKMRSTDQAAYQEQVMRYVKYLHEKTNKPVSGYLYSLVNHTLLTVIEHYQDKLWNELI